MGRHVAILTMCLSSLHRAASLSLKAVPTAGDPHSGEASVPTAGHPHQQRVAVMLVGTLQFDKWMTKKHYGIGNSIVDMMLQLESRVWTKGRQSATASHVVDRMTGEHRVAPWVDPYAPKGGGRGGIDAEKCKEVANDISPWKNAKDHLVGALSRSHKVDVFVCINNEGNMTQEQKHEGIKKIWAFEAGSQFERTRLCAQRVLETFGEYDWIIKARPDFIYYRDFPDVKALDNQVVHTRFRLAGGIANLTSDHFSYDYCESECNGYPADHAGWVNDDMVLVVPKALFSRVFRSKIASSDYDVRVPESWIQWPMAFVENAFTKFLLAHGIMTKPLACPGYPKHDKFCHEYSSRPCRNHPVPKVCGPSPRSIDDVHQEFLRQHVETKVATDETKSEDDSTGMPEDDSMGMHDVSMGMPEDE